MNKRCAIFFIVPVFFMSSAWSADDAATSTEKFVHRDWHFLANIAYTSRTLDGSIVNRTAVADDVFGDLLATGDSMNLDSSDSFMYTLAAQYKKWGGAELFTNVIQRSGLCGCGVDR